MKDLQQIVNDKVQSMIDENVIQKAIEDGVQSAITTAIENQFRSYGAITKQIEKAIEEGMALNLSDVPFETYNEQMLVAVKQKLGGFSLNRRQTDSWKRWTKCSRLRRLKCRFANLSRPSSTRGKPMNRGTLMIWTTRRQSSLKSLRTRAGATR